jgi:addiction module RelE/StbE family toxin
MVIVTSKQFDKKFAKLSKKIKLQAKERIGLFFDNPFDIRLNNHLLHGDKKLFRSINITGDIRIIYEEAEEEVVRFLDIDTHSNLYK